MVQSTLQQATFRILLPCLCDLADQGIRPAPRFGCSFVALLLSLTTQPIPLGANCLSRIFRCTGWTRLRRFRTQLCPSEGLAFGNLSCVRNPFEIHADCHSAISRV